MKRKEGRCRFIAVTSLAFVVACGGDDEAYDITAVDESTAALVACTPALIDQSSTSIEAVKCAGPWEYTAYAAVPCYKMGGGTTDPSGAVCGVAGTASSTCPNTCRHPNFGVEYFATRNVYVDDHQVCHTEYECDDSEGRPRNCRLVRVCDWVCNDPAAAVEAVRQEYPPEYRAAITHGPVSTDCWVNVYNCPVFKAGTGFVCGGHPCDVPLYKSCRHPSFGIEERPDACGTSTAYSSPGKTYAEVRTADQKAAEVARYVPKCTTADEMPMRTADEARAKWDRMEAFRTHAGALAADPQLASKITKNEKLLFELRGDLLRQNDSKHLDSVLWWMHTHPMDRHACGTYLPEVPEAAPYVRTHDFESSAPTDWGVSLTGSYSSSATAKTGLRSAMLGAPTATAATSALRVNFATHSSGGTLRFSYWATCTDTANDSMNARIIDLTSGTTAYVVASGCKNTGGWVDATFNLAPFAGHYVTFMVENREAGTGTPATVLVDALTFPMIPRHVDWYLQLCDRLSQSHVPPSVAETYAEWCIDRASDAKLIPTTYANRQAYIDAWVQTSLAEAGRAFSIVQVAGYAPGAETAAQRQPIFQSRLKLVQRWYDAAKSGVYTPYVDAADRLWRDTSALVGSLWMGAHKVSRDKAAAELAAVGKSGDAYATALGQYVTRTLDAEREVLLAAFPPVTQAAPLTKAPLMLILEDGLRSAASRIDDMATIHDLGCLFRSCSPSRLSSEMAQTMALFSSLPEKAKLDAARDAAYLVRQQWRDVFAVISARHVDVLQAAAADALGAAYDPAKAFYLPGPSLPQPLRGIAAIVIEAKRKADNFATQGLLKLSRGRLTNGLQRSKQVEISGQLSSGSDELYAAIDNYLRSVQADASYRLQEITANDKAEGLLAQLVARARAFDNALEDLTGLRASQTIADAQLANLANSFEDLLAQMPPGYVIPSHDLATLFLSEADTAYVGGEWTSIPEIAVRAGGSTWAVAGRKGDMVSFGIDDEWSPTCAIRSAGNFLDALVTAPYGQIQGTRTGPQGFYYTLQNGTFVAKSVTDTDQAGEYHEATFNMRSCHGAKVEQSIAVSGAVKAVGAQASMSMWLSSETCSGTNAGRIQSNTTSEVSSKGGDVRTSADFALGVRIPPNPSITDRATGTPFPAYPAGSLLAVLVKADGSIADVQVLQPESWVLFPEAGTLYLVVNDLNSSYCGPADTSQLVVHPTKIEPVAGTYGQQFGQALAAVQAYLRAETKNRLEQGRLLANEANELRAAALVTLSQACNYCDVSTYPAPMQTFHQALVEAEILRLERQLEMRNIERQLVVAMLEMKAIKTDIGSAERQGRFLQQLSALSLIDLDGERLRQVTTKVARLAVEEAYPFIHLRYPETVTGIPGVMLGLDSNPANLDALRNLDWSWRLDVAASKVSLAVADIIAKWQEASNKAPSPTSVMVALEFPRPGFENIPPDYRSAERRWRTAGDDRSAALWDDIYAIQGAAPAERPGLSLSIEPEDLYDSIGGPALLSCTKAMPTIEAMGVYIARPYATTSGDFNSQRFDALPIHVNPEMKWPTELGKERFDLVNTHWLSSTLPIRNGLLIDAVNTFDPTFPLGGAALFGPAGPGTAMAGRSPFTGFDIHLDALYAGYLTYDPLADAEALVVVLRLDVMDRGNLTAVETCK